jgi:hypothetical protein
MKNLVGKWTETSSGEMLEIREAKDQINTYLFNYIYPRFTYNVIVDSKDTENGSMTGLDKYVNSDLELPLNFVLKTGGNLIIKSTDGKVVATFRLDVN